MQQRTLGQQGLAVSAIGYGAMGTATGYGPPMTRSRSAQSAGHTNSE